MASRRLVGAFPAEIFQGLQYGMIFGTLMLTSFAGGAPQAWLTGTLYDITGSYTLTLEQIEVEVDPPATQAESETGKSLDVDEDVVNGAFPSVLIVTAGEPVQVVLPILWRRREFDII